MPWFKISDDWLDHPKVQRAGKNGRALWVAVGNRCAKYSSDGLIEGDLVKGIAALAEVPAGPTIRRLVELGMWHDHETLKKCTACRRDIDAINAQRRIDDVEVLTVRPGDYYSHGWADHQLSKRRTLSTEARLADDRARALRKDPELCKAIQARDRGRCRYCGVAVNWQDRRGPSRATYDHLDPWCFTPNGGNFLEAVVVSCGTCNGNKGQRTADEWAADGGHTLKPPGWRPGDPVEAPTEAPAPAAPAVVPGPETAPEPAPGTAPDPAAESPRNPVGFAAAKPRTENAEIGGPRASDQGLDLTPIYPGSDPDLIQTPGKPNSGPDSPHVHGRAHARLGPGQVGPGPGSGPGQVGPARIGLGGHGPGLAGLVRSGSGAPSSPVVSPPEVSSGGDPGPATDASRGVPS